MQGKSGPMQLSLCTYTIEELAQEDLEHKTGRRQTTRTKQIKRDRRHPHKRVSRTDPESGYLKRPGKPKGMHYLSHQTVDTDYGVILDVVVTSGIATELQRAALGVFGPFL